VTDRWVGHRRRHHRFREDDRGHRQARRSARGGGGRGNSDASAARCVEAACPPEDRGGDWGYAVLKETLADPSDEGHEERLDWLGLEDSSDFDPAAFDLARVNARFHGPV
jgi:hypothetical protein